ncbi:MAG: VCBS repeat-containing protein [Candidatus Sulfotelmatobacter sp.]
MFRSSCASRLTTSSTILFIFILASLTATSAQMNSTTVTQLKFTQHELPIGTASYNNGSSSSIITGDFNNDGILDVVTIDGTPTGAEASFFKGLGEGKFSTTPVNSPINVSNQTGLGGPAFGADFNGDGKLDLAIASGPVCCGQLGPVTILLGKGDGTFTQGESITLSTDSGAGAAVAIALADFNGDHQPDIAVSDGVNGYTWIYLGNGDGTFKLADTQKFGGNSLVAGDFNADGKQDVAYASGYESGSTAVGMFLGNGNGTLNPPLVVTGNYTSGLAVGDFYNDRIQSLAALYATGPVDGNDTTYVETLRYSNGQLRVGPSTQVTQPVAEGPINIFGGDLNGDFIDDVFISGGGYYGGPYSEYMIGNGNGSFQAPQNAPYDKQGTTFSYPIIRDMNLDSRHDVSMAWLNVEDDNGGGDVLINDNATRNCDPPPSNKLSANICAPKSGQIIGKTFTFKGAGNAFNGIAKRMELWIDGTKIGQNLEDQLNVTTTLTKGTHTASFVVVDSFDEYTSSSVTFTVR